MPGQRNSARKPPPPPNLRKLPNLAPLLRDIQDKLAADWTFYKECLNAILRNDTLPTASTPLNAWYEQMQQLVDGRDDIAISHSGVLFLLDGMKSRTTVASERNRGERTLATQQPLLTDNELISGEDAKTARLPPQERNPPPPAASSASDSAMSTPLSRAAMQPTSPYQQQHGIAPSASGIAMSTPTAHSATQPFRPPTQLSLGERLRRGAQAPAPATAKHFAHRQLPPNPFRRQPAVDPNRVFQQRMLMRQKHAELTTPELAYRPYIAQRPATAKYSNTTQNLNTIQQPKVVQRPAIALWPPPLGNVSDTSVDTSIGTPLGPSTGSAARPYHPRHPCFDSELEHASTTPNFIQPLPDNTPSPVHPGLHYSLAGKDPVLYGDQQVQRDIYEFFGRPNYSTAQQEKVLADSADIEHQHLGIEHQGPKTKALKKYKTGADDLEVWKAKVGEGDVDVGAGGQMDSASMELKKGLGSGK